MAMAVQEAGPHCAIDTLDALFSALRDWGADVPAILARAGLHEEQLHEPHLRIPHARFHQAWLAAREITSDEAIGLHVVDHVDVAKLSLFTYMASTSATAREAHQRSTRYVRIAHDALEVELREEEGRTLCRTHFRGWKSDPAVADYAVGLIVKLAPLVVEQPLAITACFEHSKPAYASEYDRILAVPVRFDAPFNGISGEGNLDAPLPNADATLCAILEEHAAELLAKVPTIQSFADQVRYRIAQALPDGDPTAEGVACSLGMSARTLRRRLREAGSSHQQLLDQVRSELAHRALGRPGVSMGEIAYLLGFSDTSAFHKAFRRWTGRAPRER